MRILLLNYEFPPLGGGASAASYELARGLTRLGHGVDVVTSRMRGQARREVREGVRTRRVRSFRRDVQDCGLWGAASYVLNASTATSRMVRRQPFDVVHYFFGLPTGALALTVPRLRALPSVLSLRGSDVPGYNTAHNLLPAVHRILHPVTRAVWARADRVVANSDALRELARRASPDRSIGMIPNAVRTDLFKPARSARVDPACPIRALCVARWVAHKGIGDLLEAMAIVRHLPVELVLQGAGPAEQALRHQARRLGITDRVEFRAFQPQAELAPVFASADIFVLPSHAESCSMALLEAMSCALPVIATGVGGTPELIEDGSGGRLLPERSPEKLAAALAELVQKPELRMRMGMHNRRQVETYGWETICAAYLDEYRAAIAAHAEARGAPPRA